MLLLTIVVVSLGGFILIGGLCYCYRKGKGKGYEDKSKENNMKADKYAITGIRSEGNFFFYIVNINL